MFKKENKKGECPKNRRIRTKNAQKKTERKDEHAKTYKFVKMSQKKRKKLLEMQKCQIRVSKRSHRQREQEDKKETTDEQIDEQKEDIKR